MCNGTFDDKDPNEAMEYLDLLAENAPNWDTTETYEAPSKTVAMLRSHKLITLASNTTHKIV